jgi:hypothetical protein
LIIATGIALPWVVGISVKLYLDAIGRPTLSLSDFLGENVHVVIINLLFWILVSIWWAVPYIVLAFVARKRLPRPYGHLRTFRARRVFFLSGLAGGCVGTVITFVVVFWEFDVFWVFVPLWILCIPTMAVGLIVGILLAGNENPEI